MYTNLPEALGKRIERIAYNAYTILGCRDYGRVDFRIDKNNEPYVLEVNPNPDISIDAGLAKAAIASGITYEQLIDKILRYAVERYSDGKKNRK